MTIRNAGPSPGRFFLLVFGVSLPFYAIGALAPRLSRWMPLGLPINALMILCPAGVALWLTHREAGRPGVRRLLGRILNSRNGPDKRWLLLSVGIMPAAMLLSYGVQRLLGQSFPHPAWSLSTVVFSFALYFFGAIGEELGWMGYAIDPLQRQYGVLTASVGLGALWWVWHVVPYHVTGRPAAWILGHGLATVMFRIIMVWIYNHTGSSVLTSVLFHAAINTSIDAFPLRGSRYDPLVTGLILLGATLLVARRQVAGTLTSLST